MSDFGEGLESIAGRVVEMLERLPAEDSVTAWDLKLKLKVGLSPLYMALGFLQERGRIRIIPDGLTYRIHLATVSKTTQPIVGIPIQIAVPGAEPASSKTA